MPSSTEERGSFPTPTAARTTTTTTTASSQEMPEHTLPIRQAYLGLSMEQPRSRVTQGPLKGMPGSLIEKKSSFYQTVFESS
jgi:hypothetical protein